jgi:hypothetical protein
MATNLRREATGVSSVPGLRIVNASLQELLSLVFLTAAQ